MVTAASVVPFDFFITPLIVTDVPMMLDLSCNCVVCASTSLREIFQFPRPHRVSP